MRLRFVSHPGLFNWACTIAQNGFAYTHVEAVMPEGGYLGAMGDGVKLRPLNYDAGEFSTEMFIDIIATPEQEDIFYEYLRSQVGKPYDYLAVAAFFWPSRDWQESGHWVCSELDGATLSMCGILPRETAVKYSRLTVLGLYQMISARIWVAP